MFGCVKVFWDCSIPDLLAVVAAGSESASAPVKAQILAPSDPGYAPTAPPKPTREQALGELTAAGYLTAPPTGIVTGTGTVGSIVRDGAQLTLLIGAPENDDIAIAVANTAADELRDVGILATVESVAPEELYGEDLTTGRVDMIVGWSRGRRRHGHFAGLAVQLPERTFHSGNKFGSARTDAVADTGAHPNNKRRGSEQPVRAV